MMFGPRYLSLPRPDVAPLANGAAATLFIETHVREDHSHLYVLADAVERDSFKLLTTVQGVGAKVGLALQGVLSTDEITRAILSGDKAAITRAPGVGPKLAVRIISELKDKVGGIALGQTLKVEAVGAAKVALDPAAGAASDAVSALVNLGYSPSQAFGVVAEAAGEIGAAASVGALIKAALVKLAPADTRAGARR